MALYPSIQLPCQASVAASLPVQPTDLLPVLASLSGLARLEVLVDVEHIDEDVLRQRLVADDDDAVLVIAVARLGAEVVGTEDDHGLVAERVDHEDLAVRDGVRLGQLQQLRDEVGELHVTPGGEREQRRAVPCDAWLWTPRSASHELTVMNA